MTSGASSPWLLIMAGGTGTRFWPRSRALRPKQLLPIVGEDPLLATTIFRFQNLIPNERIVVITTRALEEPTRKALPGFRGTILAEPEGKNTAPSLAMAMAWLRAKDPSAVAVVVPADHWITDVAAYLDVMRAAIKFATGGTHLVTVGITPTRAETGYGYIRSGDPISQDGTLLSVERFVEKPKREVAETMIQDPSYLWNAGMFVWSVDCFFKTIQGAAPELARGFAAYEKAVAGGGDSGKALADAYAKVPSISIDYALMEKAKNVVVVPGTFDWNDLGSFQSLYELFPSAEGGAARAKRVMAIDSIANLVDAPGKTVALLGVTNMMIIDVGDVLLVAAKEKSQEVKKFVERLRAEGDKDKLL